MYKSQLAAWKTKTEAKPDTSGVAGFLWKMKAAKPPPTMMVAGADGKPGGFVAKGKFAKLAGMLGKGGKEGWEIAAFGAFQKTLWAKREATIGATKPKVMTFDGTDN